MFIRRIFFISGHIRLMTDFLAIIIGDSRFTGYVEDGA
jgi:hypothetical protein